MRHAKHAKKLAVILAILFFLTAVVVFAVNAQSDSAGKVVPPGWCRIHGEVDQIVLDQRLVCIFCN